MNSNGKDPVTSVRGADGRSGKTVPPDVIPERGQVCENFSPDGSIVESKDVRHVLHEDVSGSKLANGSGHLSPQNSLRMVEPVPSPGGADSLAREPAGDDVNPFDGPNSDVSNIVNDPGIRPPLPEDPSPPLVAFAEPCVVQAGEVQAVVEQADA